MKALRIILLIVAIIVIGLFAYDLYMRNSGIENRIEYELQKHELKSSVNGGKSDSKYDQPCSKM